MGMLTKASSPMGISPYGTISIMYHHFPTGWVAPLCSPSAIPYRGAHKP